MKLTVSDEVARGVLRTARAVHAEQEGLFPGGPEWQPVHTVYLPADRAGELPDWGPRALRMLREHGDELEIPEGPAGTVRERVAAKLASEPVEDLRIDFEDGYGRRPDPEEDGHALAAAGLVAAWHRDGTLPRRWGPRIKAFADGLAERSLRTLDGFLTAVADRVGGVPDGFVVTFPKVMMIEYVGRFATYLAELEDALGHRPLRFEIQVEAPQTVTFLDELARSRDPRLTGAHLGVFDYTAACGLPPEEQRLDHPVCDHARHVMCTAFAGTGVELSDGSTNLAPPAPLRDIWRRHATHVRHSLRHGFYQGWDMHPAHLVSRFATVYAFHLARYDAYAERVRAWEEHRDADGGVVDEPATIKALTAHMRRAVACGAVPPPG